MLNFFKNIYSKLKLDNLSLFFERGQLTLIGPAFSYYALLSVFPIVLSAAMLVSLLGGQPIESLIHLVNNMLPEEIAKRVVPILRSVIARKSLGIMSISIIVTLWSTSRLLFVLRRTFNKIHGQKEVIANILTRVFAFAWLIIIVLILGCLIILNGLSKSFLIGLTDYIPYIKIEYIDMLYEQTQIPILIGIYISLCLLNYLLPTKSARPKIKYVFLGSLIEMLMLFGVNKVVSFYASITIARYDFYQSITTVIILMIWLNIIGMIMGLGQILIAWFQSFEKNQKKA